ncbi:MAG TPA: TIGR03560 family F420-dependent LLM class oxidoreductase [Solirubrobacteraceae bacterium]|nr:TIGR03560 family F420-dependent LLM class oxidoreductase [Solirubrobacteraceae bacterium]
MDLCLMIEGQEGVAWPEWTALARACEEHGIGTLFRSDHLLPLDGHEERGALDAWTTLAALAAVTTTLRLGTMVSPATFRHPSLLAKAVTTADHVSGGRVELGLGAGWHAREHAAFGFRFASTRERIDVLAEQLEIVRGHWGEGPFTFRGTHYALDALDARPKPVQRPHPPLIMGGGAGPRAAALAARFADEYNTVFATPAEVRERRARIAAACEAAGRDPIPFSVMTTVLAGADRRELRDRARRLAERLGEDGGDPDAWLAARPPAWITGTVDEVAGRLRELADAGAARVMCQHLLHEDLDAVELLGREVAPLV